MDTLFALPKRTKRHPAKYTEALLPTMVDMLRGSKRVLDPFAGVGGIFKIEKFLPDAEICGVEIEPEWQSQHPRTTLGNALHLPWPDDYFDAICTSPTYGNRMSDKFAERGKYKHITYADMLERQLSQDNSGALDWGPKYREFHVTAWTESRRVLCHGGKFVLNIKDHIRNGERQYVSDWHIETLRNLGFTIQTHVNVECPGMRFGQNGQARINYESVILFILTDKE